MCKFITYYYVEICTVEPNISKYFIRVSLCVSVVHFTPLIMQFSATFSCF
jgi:hypothetical protein